MSLKTSLIITGDSKVAVEAVDDLKESIDKLGTGSRTAATGQGALTAATNATNASARGAIVAQAGAATANTTVAATSRAAAAAQGALAVGTNVATGALASFGVTAVSVEAILTGGLSLAITAGIAFLTGFASEAMNGSFALDTQGEAARSLAEETEALNKALEQEAQTQYTAAAQALKHADAQRQLAADAVKARKALLEGAVAEAEQRRGNVRMTARGDVIDPGYVRATREVDRLKAAVAAAERDLAAKNNTVDLRRRYFVDRGIEAATNPRARVDLTYDQRRARLDQQRGSLGEAAYAHERIRLDQQRATAIDALSQSEDRASTSGRALNATRAAGSAIDRSAAAEQKKLQAELEGVIGRYDPARKAASDYADELERIAKLASAGKINPDQASEYRAEASAAYLGKALPISDLKDMAAQEQAAIAASGAIDKIVQSIQDETAALSTLDPVQRAMLGYREQLIALSPEEQAAAQARIEGALQEREATEQVRQATQDAQRAKEQLGQSAVDAFSAIVVGGQKASDVIGRLAESIAAAAIEATIFGTGPLAALLGGAVMPSAGAKDQAGASDMIGKSVGKSVEGAMDKVFGSKGSFGTVLKNAGLGMAAGGMTGSKTGGAIGGAIGGAVGKELLGSALGSLGQFAGPIGAIAGGLLGGAIGGLLKKTKTGSANITNVTDGATLSGNSSQFKAAAAGAAGSVQDGLSAIADQLGGAIGDFNVSIGQRHGDWRVRSGEGSLKVAKGAKEFDDDQEGAIAYAIQLAVSQGAVKGLSDAVQKALKSSTDINDAMEEALNVSEIETLMGGIGASLSKEFKSFEATAKERLRIATQYGFDVVAIEKKNAEDRAALTEQLLEAQVGSLQRLVDEMTSGSLFEGSALEQRDAILKEIEQAKADLAAGKDGAADTLATLLQNLNTVSKDAYGSTGQYAADRAMILDQARTAIAAANAQITAAAAGGGTNGSDPALATTNSALDENNDQNAQVISLLQTLIAQSKQTFTSSPLLDASSLARTS